MNTTSISTGSNARHIGRHWMLCTYEWGIEDCVTIQSSQGQLILVDVFQYVGTGMRFESPVTASNLQRYVSEEEKKLNQSR